jgi:FtsP/CotA-like multicopper oxidase with cupredoxin domain
LLGVGVALALLVASALGPQFSFWARSAPAVREVTLVAEEFDWEIMPGVTVRAWGYNGSTPGPEIRAREGDTVRVTLVNRLPTGTTIHWHGMDVPPAMDGPAGLNQAEVEPGEDFVYEFTATNPGSRWYHAHADPANQIALGLYGPLVIEPRETARTYDREQTYMLAEWDLELTPDVALGRAPRGPRDQLLRGGELGTDLFLINGKAHESVPRIETAAGERVLIRLMNAGNLPHAVHSHGHSFKIVATDGNPVPEGMELLKDTVLIGPGERYDLELTADNPGVWMFHCHMENHAANGMMTLIEYEGETPTGPAAADFAAMHGDHGRHAAPAPDPADQPPAPAAPPAGAPVAPPAEPVAAGETVEIALLDDRFGEKLIEVKAGTRVRFVNKGGHLHSVAAADGSFASAGLHAGDAYEVTLDTPGEYRIICKQHALRGMAAKLLVS